MQSLGRLLGKFLHLDKEVTRLSRVAVPLPISNQSLPAVCGYATVPRDTSMSELKRNV